MSALFAQLEQKNKEFQAIAKAAQERNEWEVPYDIIFSATGSVAVRKMINKLNLSFEYYDPDSSEEADVLAYTSALNELVERSKPFFSGVDRIDSDSAINEILQTLPALLKTLYRTPEQLTLNVIPKRDGAGNLYAYEFAFFPGDGATIRHVIPMEG